MKKVNLALSVALAAVMVGCGGKKSAEEAEMVFSPETTEVAGDLGECFTVVDRDYKVMNDGFIKKLTIELERTSEVLPFDPSVREVTDGIGDSYFGSKDIVAVGFGIEFLDEDGDIVDKISYEKSNSDAPLLIKLKEGKTGSIQFYVPSNETIVKFRITSGYEEKDGRPDEGGVAVSEDSGDDDADDDADSVVASSDSGSAEYDKLLDSYDEYITKYKKLLDKAATGDASVVVEYTQLMQKAKELAEKLQSVEGEMSTAQFKRFNEINLKFASF